LTANHRDWHDPVGAPAKTIAQSVEAGNRPLSAYLDARIWRETYRAGTQRRNNEITFLMKSPSKFLVMEATRTPQNRGGLSSGDVLPNLD